MLIVIGSRISQPNSNFNTYISLVPNSECLLMFSLMMPDILHHFASMWLAKCDLASSLIYCAELRSLLSTHLTWKCCNVRNLSSLLYGLACCYLLLIILLDNATISTPWHTPLVVDSGKWGGERLKQGRNLSVWKWLQTISFKPNDTTCDFTHQTFCRSYSGADGTLWIYRDKYIS